MEKTKKIVLFIVEGRTEKTALGTVLGKIYASEEVKFNIVKGDILAQNPPKEKDATALVEERIRDFCEDIYTFSDIKEVVHIGDMDGAFISDDNIEQSLTKKTTYNLTTIEAVNIDSIIERNAIKRKNIKVLAAQKNIGGIPYRFFYFACNMEHVLHNVMNATRKEKIFLADSFDVEYGDNPEKFIELMTSSSFCINGDFDDSWRRMIVPTADDAVSSLGRFCNLGICFSL